MAPGAWSRFSPTFFRIPPGASPFQKGWAMATASSTVTVDALIDARNWANRLQWCAHDFLEEIASKDGQRVLEDDFLSYWNDRWNVRFLPLLELASVCKKHGKTTFPFLQSLSRERGLYFGHAGFQTEFAHRSAYEIARQIVAHVELQFPGGFCALEEDCKQVIDELLVRPRWNPKELESQLVDECDYAIKRLNGVETSQSLVQDQRSKPTIVRFHAEQFVETTDLFVDQISQLVFRHELCKQILDADDPPSSHWSSDFIHFARRDKELVRKARDGELFAVDQREWNQLNDLVTRLDALLESGDINLLDCRSKTRHRLSLFWDVFTRIAVPFRCARCVPQWPLIEEQDVKLLHLHCMVVRGAEGVQFATPEEAQEWAQKAAWQKAKNEGLVKTKSEWLAHLLTQSQEAKKSITDVCVESLLPAVQSPEHVDWSKPDSPTMKGCERGSIDDESETILRALVRMRPRLVDLYDLEADTHISRKTVGLRVNGLIERHLAERPNGPRGGVGVTDAGACLIAELGAQSNRSTR